VRWVVLALAVLLSAEVSFVQTRSDAFLLDPSKPYVFLDFDHVGQRKPLSDSESRRGLWLRLVNNCRVPIKIDTFDPGTGNPGVGIFYDVLPVRPHSGYVTSSGEVHSSAVPRLVPQGYYFSNQTVSHRIVPPGGTILFSVPSNHVQPEWYLRAKFEFDLPETRLRQPISLVEFHWLDIPERFREVTLSK
jgi:hypothetical protein